MESHPKAKTNNVDNTVCQREAVECFLYVKGDLLRKEGNHILRLVRYLLRMNLLSVTLWRKKKKLVLILQLDLNLEVITTACNT